MRFFALRSFAPGLILLSAIAFAQTQQARNEAPIPEKSRASHLPVLCGKADDGAVHIPPDYNTLMPPDRTQSFVDPEYGCRIRRLTNGPSDFGVAVHHEYSVPFPFNADDSKVLLLRNDGFWMVVDLQGSVVIPPAQPRDGFEFTASSSEPRWDKKNPNLIYYHLTEGNQLKVADISSGKPVSRVLHTFKSCRKITFGNNEVNISEDGDHIPIVCKASKEQDTVGIYTFSSDRLSPTLELTGHRYDWIDVTADNNLLIRWIDKGPMRYQGIELFDHDLKFVKQVLPYGAHSARGRDLDGQEVLVVSSAPDHHSSCGQDGAGVQTVRLSDLKKTCLLRQGWWGEVGHISVSENGWVLITITDDNNPSTASYELPPDWKQRWKRYMNELILARIDGSQVIRLAHTRTRDKTQDDYSYWAVPRGALSRDGRYALFDSNFGVRANAADYADVYLIQLLK